MNTFTSDLFGRRRRRWASLLVWLVVAQLAWVCANADDPQTAPVPVSEAARKLTLPEGFKATLFAGEPDVVQPIGFTIDPRGRLWVAECYSYPDWSRDGKGKKDRILIFEDQDSDGRFDSRTVFAEGLVNVSGLELGFGGVWVCATPQFLFIPDRNGDDRPDGPPEVVLDGWSLDAQHNVFNGLTWGPDGWLYGLNGILSNSKVGKPGTPEAERVALNCGVWRFHPTLRIFENVASGTTNPWGLDFDERGEMFITNCVIPHLFHVVNGGHYERMFGQDLAAYSYELLKTCADHVHWDTVEKWSDIRSLGVTRTTDRAGGGHAHVGAMIYLGDTWPATYRGSAFTCNVHGHRVNRDTFQPRGSSVVASHAPDFLLANDSWFRGLELQYGPDGAVYVTDWSDTGECHEHDADGAHRENGRILKITYGDPEPVKVNLAALSDTGLVDLLTHQNEWYVRMARRLLQERMASGQDLSQAHLELKERFQASANPLQRLRFLWAAQALNPGQTTLRLAALRDADEAVRTWSVRLLLDTHASDSAVLDRLVELAAGERSARVRLALASGLQRMKPGTASHRAVAESLASRAEDAADPMLPLMVWYGVEPVVAVDLGQAAVLWSKANLPTVRRLLARRMVEENMEGGMTALLPVLTRATGAEARRDGLDGILLALRGQRNLAPPAAWSAVAAQLRTDASTEVAERALRLGLRFGDQEAAATLRTILLDSGSTPERRERALADLVEHRGPTLAADLKTLVAKKEVVGPAIRALAAFDEPEIAGMLLGRYSQLPAASRADVLETLASRPAWAMELLAGVGSGIVPKRDLTAATARRIAAFANPALSERLEAVWGAARQTSKDKAALVDRYKGLLGPGGPTVGDPGRGQALFRSSCGQCHKLHGEGGDLGPELTGSDRANLDYILQNVLDPSATVGGDYKLVVVATTDGRLLSGIIREQDPQRVMLQTANERIILPRAEIEELKTSNESMMPEGLFDKLTEAEVRDLVSYLASPGAPAPSSAP